MPMGAFDDYGQAFYGGDDEYYDEYGEEDDGYLGDGLEQYQDGIDADDISSNARQDYRRRGTQKRRRGRQTAHRYPHKTHQRRVTEHSLGDQGPTHYGQQHPYHPQSPEIQALQ